MGEITCQLKPDCTFPPHEPSAHPCGTRHVPGDPCAYCGKPTPQGGGPCPDCWHPVTIAVFKAWMAEEGFDTKVTCGESSDG